MSWHSNSSKEFEELSHSYNIVGWIDAASSEILAFHCVQTKRPYLGFAHTKLHKDALETFLAERVFTAMQTSGDALYEPDLKAIIDKDKPGAADNVNADGSTPATAKKKATKEKPVMSQTKPKAELKDGHRLFSAYGQEPTSDDPGVLMGNPEDVRVRVPVGWPGRCARHPPPCSSSECGSTRRHR